MNCRVLNFITSYKVWIIVIMQTYTLLKSFELFKSFLSFSLHAPLFLNFNFNNVECWANHFLFKSNHRTLYKTRITLLFKIFDRNKTIRVQFWFLPRSDWLTKQISSLFWWYYQWTLIKSIATHCISCI